MCDPLTLAGVALSTAGGAAQAQTNARYVDEVNRQNKVAYDMSRKARDAERVRQSAMEAQGAKTWEDTNAGLSREKFDAGKDAAAAQFMAAYDAPDVSPTLDARLPGQEAASVDVKNAVTARLNKAAADARERAKSIAEVLAFGSAGAERGRGLMDTNSDLQTLAGLRRGSLGVAAQEQDVRPATVTKGSSFIGDLLTGAGNLASYGGSGLFGGLGGGTLAPAASPRPKPNPRYLGV